MASAAHFDCDLCEEVWTGGTYATSSLAVSHPLGHSSRLIRRTTILDIYAGLGALTPGYVLVVPRRHILSCGELTTGERWQVFRTAWRTAHQIQEILKQQVVLVEHGSSAFVKAGTGPCIQHAHVHLFPLPAGTAAETFVLPGSDKVAGTDVLGLAAAEGSYYYCSWSEGHGFLKSQPVVQSQYARQVWAASCGRPDEWDWAVFPEFENAHETVALLRRDHLDQRDRGTFGDLSGLAETLDAYLHNADWYARRTTAFDSTSTLESEIHNFVSSTSGIILDAGAGAGRDASVMAGLGRPVIALDAVYELLRHVPESACLYRLVGDIRKVPLPSGSIGALWCSAVLVHLDELDAILALREFYRLLSRDGMAQISVKQGTGHVREPMNDSRVYHRHFFYYDQESLTSLAAAAGFVTSRCWTERQDDSSDNSQVWLKCRLHKWMR